MKYKNFVYVNDKLIYGDCYGVYKLNLEGEYLEYFWDDFEDAFLK